MPVRYAAVVALVLSVFTLPAASQEPCDPAESGCGSAASPYQTFPWLANAMPGMSANMNAQGVSAQWMNMQWMMMMGSHFMNAPIDS